MNILHSSITKVLAISLMIMCTSAFAAYVPPIGIPAPEFGINETVANVYGSDTYFTHYVDNTHPSATDTGNPNGSPTQPRMTIPGTLSAGSVVEVHGGPYTYTSTDKTYQLNGTVNAPIFIRGVSSGGNRVRIKGVSASTDRVDIRFQGNYFIFENLDFYHHIRIRFDVTGSHGTLRNSEVHNPVGGGGQLNPTISATGTHVVIYNNEIHDNVRNADKDVHGIQGSSGGDKIWVLNNKIYNNGGDGFQACHQCTSNTPKNIYIGGNDFSGDKENGVDLKYATDVIISQNTFSNYLVDSATGPACPIVVGSDGAPTRVWIIFNEIANSKRGIRIEEAGDLWIVGNVIRDIIGRSAIAFEKRGDFVRIVNNTIVNADLFIDQYWRTGFAANVHNNIIVDMAGTRYGNHMHFESGDAYDASDFQNNIFWQSGSDVILRLGTGQSNSEVYFSTTAAFDLHPFGSNNIIADPLFVDPLNNDFTVQASGAARDNGLSSVIYQEFQDLYGIDIRKDKTGKARPTGKGVERGAYEISAASKPATPSAQEVTGQ